jgi:DNA-binding beta-propeller fold protein YncE
MQTRLTCALGIAAALLATPLTGAAEAPGLPLALVADIQLPGKATRFDYQWVDDAKRRLYIAHLGDSSVLVFDLASGRVEREIPGLPSVHGVVAAADVHLVFATATAERKLALIDDQTFAVKGRVPAGDYPNGLAYDPTSNRVFVSNNSGHGIAVVDVKTASLVAHIDLGGGAGNTQYDAGSGHVLSAIHGRGALADIDPSNAKVVSLIPLHGVSTCHGLLIASALRLAFAACRGERPSLVVVDLSNRKQTTRLPLPPDTDVLAFDAGLGRLYTAAETGMVAVFEVASDRSVSELGRGFLGPSAHSVAVDPRTHHVYFPLESAGSGPVLREMKPSESAATKSSVLR